MGEIQRPEAEFSPRHGRSQKKKKKKKQGAELDGREVAPHRLKGEEIHSMLTSQLFYSSPYSQMALSCKEEVSLTQLQG